MHRWLVLTVLGLLVSGIGPHSARADQGGKQSAAKASDHSPGFDKDAYEEGEGGILYGKGWAFMIAAPRGWVMDDQGKMMGGEVNAAFCRRGESWAKARAVMYATVVPKVKGEDDTLEKVVGGDIEQTKEHDPKMEVKRGEPLDTADGRSAVVYTFSGPGTGRAWEKVAYVDTHRFVIMLALTARSKPAYEAALPDFVRLVHSFGFFPGGVQTQQAKPARANGAKKSR